MKATIAMVNEALRKRGRSETLVKGRGYAYFTGGETARWRATSVYVYRISDLSISEWLEEHRQLSEL